MFDIEKYIKPLEIKSPVTEYINSLTSKNRQDNPADSRLTNNVAIKVAKEAGLI